MTRIIRAEAPHDFLALVPALAGYLPTRSLVCVAFRGNRTAGLVRHDLPERGAGHDALAGQVVATLCRMPGVDALVPIAYVGGGFEARPSRAARALVGMVVDRAEDAGFLVRDAFVVAADGWASTFDTEAPAAGHPISRISASGARHDPAVQASEGGRVDDAAVLPPTDVALADEVAAVLGALADACDHERAAACDPACDLERAAARDPACDPERDPDRAAEPDRDRTADAAAALGPARFVDLLHVLGDDADPVRFVERLVARRRRGRRGAAPERDANLLAWLTHLSGLPACRDAMMLQVAFGELVGEAVLDESLTRDPARDDPMSARLLLGRSSVRPDVGRVERGLAILRSALAHAPQERHAGLACMAAWLAWTLGRGTAAAALLERAFDADPGHPMAGLLQRFLGTGALPEWAFSGASSLEFSDR
ncbi:DUF4192 family protein [Agromyces sp. MMS24-JH15]|uniref:DUF4192 family protein n=1 Tax=Agromyces sp. MMS24-JH15 TaxID=3243765 RepID=UPI0037487339